jgi:hypothetical protein
MAEKSDLVKQHLPRLDKRTEQALEGAKDAPNNYQHKDDPAPSKPQQMSPLVQEQVAQAAASLDKAGVKEAEKER